MDTTYRTAGTTDDVTTCSACGRDELRGTVRLELVNGHGVVVGETFVGSSCAATLAGRSAAVITREARTADRDRDDAAREAAHREAYDAEQHHLDALGLPRTFANVKHVRALISAVA